MPEVKCKCGGRLFYRPIASSGAWVCEDCGWLTFQQPVLVADDVHPHEIHRFEDEGGPAAD